MSGADMSGGVALLAAAAAALRLAAAAAAADVCAVVVHMVMVGWGGVGRCMLHRCPSSVPLPRLQLEVDFAGVDMENSTKLPEKSFTAALHVISPNGEGAAACGWAGTAQAPAMSGTGAAGAPVRALASPRHALHDPAAAADRPCGRVQATWCPAPCHTSGPTPATSRVSRITRRRLLRPAAACRLLPPANTRLGVSHGACSALLSRPAVPACPCSWNRNTQPLAPWPLSPPPIHKLWTLSPIPPRDTLSPQ